MAAAPARPWSAGRSKGSGRRSRVVLATKVHFPMDDDDPNAQGNSRRHIIEQCEASLRRLQTDYIDLYQVHRPVTDVPLDETLRALDDLIRAGKVRYVGTSTFPAWQVVESLWLSRELGLNRMICDQPPYHLLDRRVERELVPMALNFGIGIIPWAPLAGGFLTGRYARGASPPSGSRYERSVETQRQRGLFTDAGVCRGGRADGHRRRQGLHARPAGPGVEHAAAGDHEPHRGPAHAGAVGGEPGRDQR